MARVSNTTETEAVTLSALARWGRTALQVVISFGVSFAPLVAGLGLPAATAAKVSGILSAIVLAASAIQNLLEKENVISTLGAGLPEDA